MSSLGKNLKFFRENIDLKQHQLADKVGVTRNYITMIETSKKVPSIKILHKLADELNISAKDLINRDPLFEELRIITNKYDLEEIMKTLKALNI